MATEWQQGHWIVVSRYADGDRVVEGVWPWRAGAEQQAERVRRFREDQDEMPTITVEKVR